MNTKFLKQLNEELGISRNILNSTSTIYDKFDKEFRPYRRDLGKELRTIVNRGQSLGFILRYVDSRIKSFDSLIFNWLPEFAVAGKSSADSHFREYLQNQYDFLGARIVALNLSDVVRAARLILGNEHFGWTRDNIKNFYSEPKTSGYRSWHLRVEFYPDPKNLKKMKKCEIQIRTGLEDIWGEWEHELIYKKPRNISDQWTDLIRHDSKLMAHKLYDIALWLDRHRERLETLRQPKSQQILELMRQEIPVTEDDIKKYSSHFDSHTKILASNLCTGLDSNHLFISFDPGGSIGLSLKKEKEKEEIGRDDQLRFNFEDLERSGKSINLSAYLSDSGLHPSHWT